MRLVIALFVVLLMGSCGGESVERRADRLHASMISIDSHTDTPLNFLNDGLDVGIWNDGRATRSKYDFPRMKAGGLDAAFFAVFVGQRSRDPEGNSRAIHRAHLIFDALDSVLAANADAAAFATSPDDVLTLKNRGKRAIYAGIENGYVIGDSIPLIEYYYNRGARYMTLVHTRNNDICDSANDTIEHNGLSAFGLTVVEEMNRLGMMVDVSHASDKAFYDVLEASSKPVIASHSCARALCDNPRNLTDDQLRAIAANGGVVQMCILNEYVKTPAPNAPRDSAFRVLRNKYRQFKNMTEAQNKAAWQEWQQIDEQFPQTMATVSDVVDHIDHMVKVAGIDHVGIGTDFDGGGGVEGCFDVSEMKNITQELIRRGYSDADIAKIWGENLLRVFRAAQQV